MGDLVDLEAYRAKKQKELEEKEKAEQEERDREEIEYMRIVLVNIMEQLGNPEQTGSIFYVPMTDDDYFSQYQFDSGYDDNGDWYSSWEAEGFNEEDYLYDPEEEN